ncbi:mas-related G-protein coupled receptor member H-like [Tiliqua scincoides]|uniref:mas-related G-protein coupled receptor member H-like n=1 Tax=Tiliqua scincoides TaxID=71010 RepID=UPI0034636E9F
MDTEHWHFTMDNGTGNNNSYCKSLEEAAFFSVICVVCIFGVVGNGIVIWLLGFRIKRTPFTIYILNLAVADFGVFLSMPIRDTLECNASFEFPVFVAESCLQSVYCASLFLLTSISIDRCVSVLFPLWYRCRRPEKLSTILCALIWLISFLGNGICTALHLLEVFINHSPIFYVFLVNAMICLPLIMISTLILVIRICFKPQLRQQRKLLMAILLSLLFFLILAFPLNVICLVYFASPDPDSVYLTISHLLKYGAICVSLNSFVNPLIYFFIGRRKRGLRRKNLKLILQRVFSEKEICAEKLEP